MFTIDQKILVLCDGITYEGIKSANISRSMEDASGNFSLEVSKPEDKPFPLKKGSKVTILIYNVPFITGYVEKIRSQKDISNHTITIEGRDKTCDMIDSTLPAKLSISTPISLVDITKKILTSFNITDVNVIVEADDVDNFTSNEMVGAELGETGFDFLEKYAKKRQVILTTNGKGDIVYTRSQDTYVKDFINIDFGFNKGYVLSASAEFDDSKRFNKYIISAQTNATAPAAKKSLIGANSPSDEEQLFLNEEEGEDEEGDDAQDQPPPEKETYVTAEYVDDEVRNTRVHHFLSDTTSTTQKALKARAQWEANIRKANSFTYTLTVFDFRNSKNEVWKPNMLIDVTDSAEDIATSLLILSVNFTADYSGGCKTELKLVPPEAFKLLTEKKTKKDKKQNKKKKQGNEFKALVGGGIKEND